MSDLVLQGNLQRVRIVSKAIEGRMQKIRSRTPDYEHHDDVLFTLGALDELAVVLENVIGRMQSSGHVAGGRDA